MIDKFESIKMKTFYSFFFFFLQVENELQLLYLQSQASHGGKGEAETGKRQEQEVHRKGATNVHEHEKVVNFISNQGNANKSQVTISHPLE